jgi:tetratricopeptide (TPR) repeat protein
MLAQLEAMEGDIDTARSMAREAVTLLEGIGAADAARAKEVLAGIEAFAARGQSPDNSLQAQLMEMLKRVTTLPPDQALAEIDAGLASARQANQPAQATLLALARSVVCGRAQDGPGCDESLQLAEEALQRGAENERSPLAGLIEALKKQRAEAETGRKADSVRLYQEAMGRLNAGDPESALALLEDSLVASRVERSDHNVAMNLLTIGQVLLSRGKPAEAVVRLREGLDVAAALEEEELLRNLREAATAAARAAAMLESFQTPLHQVLAEAPTDEARAEALLSRAMTTAWAARNPEEASALAGRALEFARSAGVKALEARVCHFQGMLAARQGRAEEARGQLQQALKLAEDEGLTDLAADLAQALAAMNERRPS